MNIYIYIYIYIYIHIYRLRHADRGVGAGVPFALRWHGSSRVRPQGPILETTQGQIDGFVSQLQFKYFLPEVASVGDWLRIYTWVAFREALNPKSRFSSASKKKGAKSKSDFYMELGIGRLVHVLRVLSSPDSETLNSRPQHWDSEKRGTLSPQSSTSQP